MRGRVHHGHRDQPDRRIASFLEGRAVGCREEERVMLILSTIDEPPIFTETTLNERRIP
jgi:hypothetical protein